SGRRSSNSSLRSHDYMERPSVRPQRVQSFLRVSHLNRSPSPDRRETPNLHSGSDLLSRPSRSIDGEDEYNADAGSSYNHHRRRRTTHRGRATRHGSPA
ncbi:unnamed protein product, partial [Amoebophrya sp. A120]